MVNVIKSENTGNQTIKIYDFNMGKHWNVLKLILWEQTNQEHHTRHQLNVIGNPIDNEQF